ncbi:hypothetical protein [Streptomyces sp. NPDC007991]|uniref:hypothetical protein n=1 Tax=Streptomyces sp. NPDC007991 TaxID=3364803 RepID=UPI0036E4FAE4
MGIAADMKGREVGGQTNAAAADRRFGMRDGFGLAGVILCLVVGTSVILLVMGLWKRFARETVPVLVNLPGGSWALGGALGVITALGAVGCLRSWSGPSGGSRLTRGLRAAGTALCCAAAFGPLFYLLSALPGKNCRSASCEYIPGTGTAFLAYVVVVGAVGWLCFRWFDARAKGQAARERERLRKLRKKGKGKSRAA